MSERDHSRSEPSPSEQESVSPPAGGTGRPRREGNDSLWKRARRTLGTQNLTFLQPQARPSGANVSGTGSGPAAPSKRREQVRHAQRTHRQRTQNYIKTLENEVVRLRESDTKHMEERDNLLNQVHTLKVTIISANLRLPPGLEDPAPTDQPNPLSDFDMQPATISYSNDNTDHQRLHVTWPETSVPTSITSYGLASPYGGAPPQAYPLPKSEPEYPNDFSLQPLSVSGSDRAPSHPARASSRVKPPFAADTMQTAIDFVLALEHPCMAHLPYQPDPNGADPANHMMLASTPLMAHAPETPQPNSSWLASSAIIKELLNLSSGINLEGEITPVEAWHRLHQHPDFHRLDKYSIQALKNELSQEVSCQGFGAVLSEDFFWQCFHRQLIANSTGLT